MIRRLVVLGCVFVLVLALVLAVLPQGHPIASASWCWSLC